MKRSILGDYIEIHIQFPSCVVFSSNCQNMMNCIVLPNVKFVAKSTTLCTKHQGDYLLRRAQVDNFKLQYRSLQRLANGRLEEDQTDHSVGRLLLQMTIWSSIEDQQVFFCKRQFGLHTVEEHLIFFNRISLSLLLQKAIRRPIGPLCRRS